VFGRWLKSALAAENPGVTGSLERAVREQLPNADEESIRVVTAITGLLGTVAYADRDYAPDEEARVRAELLRVHGMTEAGADAVCAALRANIIDISTVQAPRFSRVLTELADRELRLEVLELLVALAAADGSITHAETNVLRQVTTALGLTQVDYNAAQAKYKDRLLVLRGTEPAR
jgi:uncharacterized tellurite resistance protein B-like protein